MFPNPQDALPLPARPNLEQYKKLAKDLLKSAQTGHPSDLNAWVDSWVRDLVRHSALEVTPRMPVDVDRWIVELSAFANQRLLAADRKPRLADAQYVLARAHGFASWPKFAKHLGDLAHKTSAGAEFEAAADAIVSGDLKSLQRLLTGNPALAKQRSNRDHHATLLHYTSANGVEGYRQKTPPNIVAIAELLLKAGADVNAEADVYGGGATTLGLAATSLHPEVAGVQIELLQLLLDHGARIETPGKSAVFSCLANGRPQAAAFLADHGAKIDLVSAAGVGRLETIKSYFNSQDGPSTGIMQRALVYACMYGHEAVVRFLLERGADPNESADTAATPLHWAAGGGHRSVVELLLEHGAPLEARNQWNGTVLEQAGYGFEHAISAAGFAEVFELLLRAGAKIHGQWLTWIQELKTRAPAEKAEMAEIFRRYGATT